MITHACETPSQAVAACEHVILASTSTLSTAGASSSPLAASQPEAGRSQAGLLLLSATATETLARLYQQTGQLGQLPGLAEKALEQAISSPDDYAGMRAAAAALVAVREHILQDKRAGKTAAPDAATVSAARALLSVHRLQACLPPLAPLLAQESQPARAAVLALLYAFDAVPLKASESEQLALDSQTPAVEGEQHACMHTLPVAMHGTGVFLPACPYEHLTPCLTV